MKVGLITKINSRLLANEKADTSTIYNHHHYTTYNPNLKVNYFDLRVLCDLDHHKFSVMIPI